ncbi:TPA: hypothetical protein ACFRG8_001746 [Neisseria lactamica]
MPSEGFSDGLNDGEGEEGGDPADPKPELAQDAEWDESKHPRAENGRFGGGGSSQNNAADISGFLGTEYQGKGQAAIQKLRQEKNGYIKGAFHRSDIGDIALVLGNDDVGLKHIIKRREEQGIDVDLFLEDIDEVIEKGNIQKSQETGNFEIWHNKKMAVISPEFKGNQLMFLLTAFKSRKQKTNP